MNEEARGKDGGSSNWSYGSTNETIVNSSVNVSASATNDSGDRIDTLRALLKSKNIASNDLEQAKMKAPEREEPKRKDTPIPPLYSAKSSKDDFSTAGSDIDETIQINSTIYEGEVESVSDHSAIIKCYNHQSKRSFIGVLYNDNISNNSVRYLDDLLHIGMKIYAKVIDIDPRRRTDPKGIKLSCRNIDFRTGKERNSYSDDHRNHHHYHHHHDERNKPLALPELNSIHLGKVESVKPFGVFVSIPGCREQGLVHISHLAPYRVESTNNSYEPGDPVYIKVVGIEKDEKTNKTKLSLSIKLVSQTDGKDLDPTHAKGQNKPPKQDRAQDNNNGGSGTSGRQYEESQRTQPQVTHRNIVERDALDIQFANSKQTSANELYPIIIDEVNKKKASQDISTAGPVGRGRMLVQPSWMTNQEPSSLSAMSLPDPSKNKPESSKIASKPTDAESDSSSDSDSDNTSERNDRHRKKKSKKHKRSRSRDRSGERKSKKSKKSKEKSKKKHKKKKHSRSDSEE